jgi:ArsR family metal-binding transcriptional regulator
MVASTKYKGFHIEIENGIVTIYKPGRVIGEKIASFNASKMLVTEAEEEINKIISLRK